MRDPTHIAARWTWGFLLRRMRGNFIRSWRHRYFHSPRLTVQQRERVLKQERIARKLGLPLVRLCIRFVLIMFGCYGIYFGFLWLIANGYFGFLPK